ncbi:MAG TPA: PAS domain S-box protein [Steroidobacteraceae bacterium]|nr:PAS domain S-box protein [Steroidobacteraceae bacterium]
MGTQTAMMLSGLSTVALVAAMVWLHRASLARVRRSHQEALEALSSSEERTRLIVEGALDAVVTIDSSGNIIGWNTHAEATFGWSCEEVMGRELSAIIIPPRHAEAHHAGMKRYLETGLSRMLNRRVELTALDRSGREFPIEIAITPLRTSTGVSFCAFVRDITRRQEALASLHDSERRFRTLAESVPHLVWTCRPDGWCDFLGHQWVEYTGRPLEEQLGYGWMTHLHADDQARAQESWAAAAARGGQYDEEMRIRRRDGAYRWFKTRAIPLKDDDGSIVKWFGTCTDITDYKAFQHEMRTQIERLSLLDRCTRAIGERQDLREVFEAVLDRLETGFDIDFGCICTWDAGHVLTVNGVGAASRNLVPALQLLPGTRLDSEAEGLGRATSGHLVHEPDLARATAVFSRRLAAGGLGAVVFAPLTVESRIFGVLVAARRQPDSFSSADCEFLRQLSGHVALAAHQAELYSNLQTAYDDLRRSQQAVMQQERLRAVGQMASGVAHDINNALSPAALYVQSILEREPDLSPRVREQMKVVEQAIGSVADTIERLREFYREREPQQPREPVHPNEAIGQAMELTRARWHDIPQRRGVVIELQMDLAPNLPAIVATASELRDAITNLILNAVDAMPQGGVLALQSSLLPGVGPEVTPLVRIAVRDTGVGMSAETRRRCLEPFFTTKGELGTGLGLPMVYGMLERHGGRIEIASEPGAGTEMSMLFPVARVQASDPGAAAPATPPALHVLLVDDDPVLLRTLREILETDGHRVVAVNSGQEGIDALREMQARGEQLSVVITDLGMPHVDGRRVAAAAKALPTPPAVIMLTGWGQRLLDEGDIPPHVDRMLGKPPRLAQLRTALAELAGGVTGDNPARPPLN